MILPDVFIDQDSPAKMYEAAGLASADVVTAVLSALGEADAARRA